MKLNCQIMGILNVTPDSFYDGGKYNSIEPALNHAKQMYEDGADIIDVGGESSRPGAQPITTEEEIVRVCPVIEKIAKEFPIKISIDTYKAEVAKAALQAGATMINDIGGLQHDLEMVTIAAKYKAEIVIMHMKGSPENMQENPLYDNIIPDIYKFLEKSINLALQNGIKYDKIIIDPGIGFGKTLEDNYKILKHIKSFEGLNSRILIGLSRKSLIGNLYKNQNNQTPVDRLPGTIALNVYSMLMGASIIRVHDVKEHRLALDCLEELQGT